MGSEPRPGTRGLAACTACAMTGEESSGEARGSGVGDVAEVARAGAAAALLGLTLGGRFDARFGPWSQGTTRVWHARGGQHHC